MTRILVIGDHHGIALALAQALVHSDDVDVLLREVTRTVPIRRVELGPDPQIFREIRREAQWKRETRGRRRP